MNVQRGRGRERQGQRGTKRGRGRERQREAEADSSGRERQRDAEADNPGRETRREAEADNQEDRDKEQESVRDNSMFPPASLIKDYDKESAYQTWFVSGRREVINDCRDGEHTLIWQNACWKRRESFASASRLGVTTGRP